jgi:hypothetical protein
LYLNLESWSCPCLPCGLPISVLIQGSGCSDDSRGFSPPAPLKLATATATATATGLVHLHVHMENIYLHTSHSRPLRPNVYDRDARPSIRVSPEDSSSRQLHLHKHKSSHRHRHRHHEDEHRRHSSTRHHAKEVVQSALQPPTSFGDLLKQARSSKHSSRSHSRSRSRGASPARVDANEQQKAGDHIGLAIPPPQPLRPEEVEREAKRVDARERCALWKAMRPASGNMTTGTSAPPYSRCLTSR